MEQLLTEIRMEKIKRECQIKITLPKLSDLYSNSLESDLDEFTKKMRCSDESIKNMYRNKNESDTCYDSATASDIPKLKHQDEEANKERQNTIKQATRTMVPKN